MDNVELAALCTQSIILDILDNRGISVDDFAKRIASTTIGSWREKPVMTYEEFLRSCKELKGVSAPKLFSETKKRLTEGWKPGKPKGGGLGETPVDVKKAHMDVPSAMLMDWDAVIESMASAVHRDVQDVRSLFSKAPTKVDANTIAIHSVKKGEKSNEQISRLIRLGMKKAGVEGADDLAMRFDDGKDS